MYKSHESSATTDKMWRIEAGGPVDALKKEVAGEGDCLRTFYEPDHFARVLDD
jgi:hypothetical protein